MSNLLPDSLLSWMDFFAWTMSVTFSLWMTLILLSWFHRRAYNLTSAERIDESVASAEYLGTQQARRLAAQEQGQAYDAGRQASALASGDAITPARTGTPIPDWLENIAVIGSLSAAILTVGLAVAAVVLVGGPESMDSPLLARGWASLIEHRGPVLGASLLVLGVSLLRFARPKATA